MKKYLMQMIRGQRSFIDIWHYLVGNYRYSLYYSKRFSWLMRSHIREQIKFRIEQMDKECYNNGECKLCGCQTTALQMCNKPCDKPCYPSLMTKPVWKIFKDCKLIIDEKTGIWQFCNNKLINLKNVARYN